MRFSIVIPIYNSETTLRTCLSSVANQSYKDFEAILVDDGSTDGSAAICHEFVSQDKRFIYYHQTNQGSNSAYERGLNSSKGEYIVFLDSDDYYSLDALAVMNDAIIADRPDVVQVCFRLCDENGSVISQTNDPAHRIYRTHREVILACAKGEVPSLALSFKCFRRSLFSNIPKPCFRGAPQGADTRLARQLLSICDTLVTCSKGYYVALWHDSSQSHQRRNAQEESNYIYGILCADMDLFPFYKAHRIRGISHYWQMSYFVPSLLQLLARIQRGETCSEDLPRLLEILVFAKKNWKRVCPADAKTRMRFLSRVMFPKIIYRHMINRRR